LKNSDESEGLFSMSVGGFSINYSVLVI
jgi:hypothetical protein